MNWPIRERGSFQSSASFESITQWPTELHNFLNSKHGRINWISFAGLNSKNTYVSLIYFSVKIQWNVGFYFSNEKFVSITPTSFPITLPRLLISDDGGKRIRNAWKWLPIFHSNYEWAKQSSLREMENSLSNFHFLVRCTCFSFLVQQPNACRPTFTNLLHSTDRLGHCAKHVTKYHFHLLKISRVFAVRTTVAKYPTVSHTHIPTHTSTLAQQRWYTGARARPYQATLTSPTPSSRTAIIQYEKMYLISRQNQILWLYFFPHSCMPHARSSFMTVSLLHTLLYRSSTVLT